MSYQIFVCIAITIVTSFTMCDFKELVWCGRSTVSARQPRPCATGPLCAACLLGYPWCVCSPLCCLIGTLPLALQHRASLHARPLVLERLQWLCNCCSHWFADCVKEEASSRRIYCVRRRGSQAPLYNELGSATAGARVG